MGGGKGSPDHYVATVKPGTVLLEMEGGDRRRQRGGIGFSRAQTAGTREIY